MPATFSTWRLYASNSWHPGFDYLILHFGSLFNDAVSKDPARIDKLHKTLFALLQNDANVGPALYELIALIAFTMKYPHYFDHFKKPDNTFDLIRQIGEIFSQHKNELQNATVLLIEYEPTTNILTLEKPLSSDHVSEPTRFALATITHEQECKHPLEGIFTPFFSEKIRLLLSKILHWI